jgi:methylated-DNA-[protein]-cysteine S-methyltransferase
MGMATKKTKARKDDPVAAESAVVDSPAGRLRVTTRNGAVKAIEFMPRTRRRPPPPGARGALLRKTIRQLEAYAAGKRRDFDLPLAPEGTAFQREVWDEVARIPRGGTATYADIARRIGRPTAVRATGAANGRNPLPILVPCHRVVGSSGRLTGYGGGLEAKQRLLQLEGVGIQNGRLAP